MLRLYKSPLYNARWFCFLRLSFFCHGLSYVGKGRHGGGTHDVLFCNLTPLFAVTHKLSIEPPASFVTRVVAWDPTPAKSVPLAPVATAEITAEAELPTTASNRQSGLCEQPSGPEDHSLSFEGLKVEKRTLQKKLHRFESEYLRETGRRVQVSIDLGHRIWLAASRWWRGE